MKRKITFLSAALMLLAFLAFPMGMRGQTATLVSGSGTSGYAVPDGWTTSGTVEGGSYLKFADGTMTSPEFAPHDGLSFTYSVATFGSGDNHPLTIRILNASTDEVIVEMTTATPTSSTYINTGSPLSLGDVTVAFKIQMYGPNNKAVRLRNYSVTGNPAGGQQLTPSDLALTDAPVELEFDLYDNADAQTISYTTSSTGEVTVSQSDYITATVNANNTITVTPVAVTNGPQTITVNQAADDTYAAGSVTFTIDIEDSTPSTGSDVTFNATVDQGEGSIVKDGVTFTCDNGVLNNGSEYRLYKNSTTTFSVTSGTITQIVFTCPSSNPASGFETQTGWTTNGNNGTWTGSAESVSFVASNKQVRATQIVVTVENGGTPAPSIVANNVEIAYDATTGSITYTIENGVDGGTVTAATESESWLTLPETFASPIEFTCTANEAAADRTATVTLTYTYDSQTVTKNVTVTQAGDPNVTPTIAQVREQGTGEVVTRGIVTSCSGITAYIQDATAAICVYGEELTVGDEIRVSGTLTTYKGLLEIANNPQVTVLSSGNVIEPQLMTVGEVVASTNQGWYIRIEEATVTGINNKNVSIAQGDNTIVVYFNSTDDITFVENDVISLNGNIGCYNTTQIANPQNVEVQQNTEPSITVTPATVPAPVGGSDGVLNVTYENITTVAAEIAWYEATGAPLQDGYDWIDAEIDADNNVYYVINANNGEARTAYLKVWAYDDDLNEVYSNLVTINQEAYVAPVASITFDPDSLIFDSELHYDGALPFTYENIIVENNQSFGLQFYTAEGEETGMPEWFFAMVTPRSNENNGEYQVSCAIMANEGEARSVYFKVYAFDADSIPVYSNLATVTQTAPVFDYAILPFVWEGGSSADFLALNGVTANGLGNDYASGNAPYLIKFDGTGDYIQVKTDSQPGMVTINVKMIGGSDTSTITIQGSADGENFTDIEELTISGSQNDELTLETTNAFGANDRYVRMLFTKGSNVGVGPITITKGTVPSITLTPDIFELEAVGPLNGMHLPSMMVYCHNLEIAQASDFNYQFYNAEGEEQEMPEWILHSEVSLITETGYQAICIVTANEGPARSAYFKVYAYDADSNPVYSNLVTINQAAYEAPAETWVLTDLADLTEGDVFVIVGTRYDDNYAGNYAMPNDNDNSAPGAVAITINGEALAEEPAANLQWNISRTGNSYTFYPNGDTENWLYCTNANNGVKVGVGSAHHFTLSDNGYLTTTETTVQRYLGIYNSQDWRCYTSEGGNIANQTFAFYKKNVSTQTYNLTINGYGQSEGGYRLIASPVYVNPENTGMITDDGTDPENYTYDFYFFDQAQEDEWRNYRQEAFNLVPGKGYLYAHNTDVELTFTGIPYSGDGTITLVKDDNAVWAGWNLVGNPFGTTAYLDRDFYVMNEAGTEILTDACTGAVEAMQGVFVIAEEDDEALTFSTEAPEAAANVTLNLSQNRGAVIDRAIVRFGEGRQLPKFQLNAESTKLYIPQGNNDYAVVSSATQGEMPMNFKAQNNGTYTISVNTENAETNYLHLIDNMTGADIDLLQTPSYTFEAKTTDYASRFRLVFNVTGIEENTTSTEPFAFFNGSEWVINNTGEATLQMVDLTGRILSSESISGNATVSTANLSTGIYMMRLVNSENVKTQKVVIK